MRTLVYQCWLGQRPEYTYVSEQLFRTYAEKIGADYYFSDKPFRKMCLHRRYFGKLTPIYDPAFDDFDAVLYTDMDMIPVEGIQANIFDDMNGDFMVAEEIDQPELRLKMAGQINSTNDQKWAAAVKRHYATDVIITADGKPKVFNTGAILFSGSGLRKLRRQLPNILQYQILMKLCRLPRFYALDQNFLNAFLTHKAIDFQYLDPKWNSQVTSISQANGEQKIFDYRTPESCFIHMQHGAFKPKMSREEALSVSRGEYEF